MGKGSGAFYLGSVTSAVGVRRGCRVREERDQEKAFALQRMQGD